MINPFGFIITVLYFKIAQKLKKLPILKNLPPILTAGILLILTLELFDIDYKTYNESASYITLLLIPATISLGYPIYKNTKLLKKNKRIIYCAFFVAVFVAVISTYIIAKFCHTNLNIIESMLPKSVTAPIAVEISKSIGAIPELTACVVVLTGVFGALFGHKILALCKVKNDIAIGLSMGASSHVIGTSRCVEIGKSKQVVMASVAFVLVALITTLMIPLFLLFLNLD